jgi:hypothetical protein
MQEDLQIWLKTKDYQKGIVLVEKFAPDDAFLLRLLRSGKNSLTVAKLEKKVMSLLSNVPETKIIPQKTKAIIKPLLENPKADLKHISSTFDEDKSEKPEVIELVNHRKNSYVQRTQLKAKLNLMVWEAKKFTNLERGIVGRELTKTCLELKHIWDQVLYFRKYGTLPKMPETKENKITNINEIHKRITVVRTYLTKIKNGILTDKKLHIYTAEMEQLQKQIDETPPNPPLEGRTSKA